MATHWMIYGANGYTGHLIAAEAKRQGLTPILAGRNPAAVHALGSLLGLECRIFDIHQLDRAKEALADIAVVAHCRAVFRHQRADARCLLGQRHALRRYHR